MAAPRLGIALASGTDGGVARHLEGVLAAAARCEAAGVELLVLDGRPPPGASGRWKRLDPFAVLGAVAAETRVLRLGALVGADERAPSLHAKATSTLDVCSGGRAVLVLSGPSSPAAPDGDVALLGECVGVVRAMLTEPAPTILGRHVAVQGAWNEPRSAGSPPAVGILVASDEDAEAVASSPSSPGFVLVGADAPWSRRRRAPSSPGGPATGLLVRHVGPTPSAPLPGPGDVAILVVGVDDPAAVTGDLFERLAAWLGRDGSPGC